MIALRPYQHDAIKAVLAARARGVQRQLVSMPTGTGKTVVFASLARQMDDNTLILAHRDELISQAVDKVRLVWPDADVGVVKAERNEMDRQVVVASVQTLARSDRLERLGDFGLLVTDEAHHAVAETYQRVYNRLDGVLHVGVTATPRRGDKAGLEAIYDEVTYHLGLLDAIKGCYLCDLRGLRVRSDVDLSSLHSRYGDFAETELAEAVNVPARNDAIVEAWQDHAAGRQTLAFTVDVQHARDIAEAFGEAGVRAKPIHGEMPIEERRALLRAFHAGNVQVLTNCALLTEGYDEPSVSCIVVARPTQSQALYMQMIGRGTRLYPGKEDCLVIDVADVTRRHSLVQLPTLFGLQPEEKKDGTPTATILEQVQKREEAQRRGPIVVEAVDLFRRSSLHWLQVKDAWVLAVPGHGQIRLTPLDEGYRPAHYEIDGRQIELADHPLSLSWAQGVGEDTARRLLDGQTRIVARNAPWRAAPATDKQLDTLRRMRVAIRPGLTKGEASDLIGERIALRGLRLA